MNRWNLTQLNFTKVYIFIKWTSTNSQLFWIHKGRVSLDLQKIINSSGMFCYYWLERGSEVLGSWFFDAQSTKHSPQYMPFRKLRKRFYTNLGRENMVQIRKHYLEAHLDRVVDQVIPWWFNLRYMVWYGMVWDGMG